MTYSFPSNRSYLIKGSLPKYNPPESIPCKVDATLPAEFDLRVSSVQPKNHLTENIKNAKNVSAISKRTYSRSIV